FAQVHGVFQRGALPGGTADDPDGIVAGAAGEVEGQVGVAADTALAELKVVVAGAQVHRNLRRGAFADLAESQTDRVGSCTGGNRDAARREGRTLLQADVAQVHPDLVVAPAQV